MLTSSLRLSLAMASFVFGLLAAPASFASSAIDLGAAVHNVEALMQEDASPAATQRVQADFDFLQPSDFSGGSLFERPPQASDPERLANLEQVGRSLHHFMDVGLGGDRQQQDGRAFGFKGKPCLVQLGQQAAQGLGVLCLCPEHLAPAVGRSIKRLENAFFEVIELIGLAPAQPQVIGNLAQAFLNRHES